MGIGRMRTRLLATAAASVMGVLAGCAMTHASADASSKGRPLPGKPACLYRGNFLGSWQVLDNSSLILYAFPSDREAYLVELFQPVFGLKFNVRLGLMNVQRTGYLCANGSSYLVVPGNSPERILITQLRKLTDSERDQLLAQAGHPSPHRSASSPNATAE